MKDKIKQDLVVGFLVVTASVGAATAVAHRSVTALAVNSQWTNHTHEILEGVERVRSILESAGSGQRGYLITGRRDFLDEVDRGAAEVPGRIDALVALTADNPPQQERLRGLKGAALEEFAALRRVAGRKDAGAAGADLVGEAAARDSGLMRDVRRRAEEIVGVERVLLAAREGRARDDARRSAVALYALACGSLVASLLSAVAIAREVRRRERVSLAVAESEERFRLMVEGVNDCALFSLDPGGRVSGWNVGAERLLGYGAAEVTGRHFSFLFPNDEAAVGAAARELERAAASAGSRGTGGGGSAATAGSSTPT